LSAFSSSPLRIALEGVLGSDGLLQQRLDGYEPREGQVEMMTSVADAIDESQVLLVEAPTGTGKSLAYLIPSLLSGRKTVVSTATRTLQDQLFHKELPFIREKLEIDFEAALLKGRTNYLCLHLLSECTAHSETFQAHREWFVKLLKWSRETLTGDRRELSELPDDSPLWPQVSTGAEGCLGHRCASYEDCFVVTARKKAAQADLVVVNHHLLFADLSLHSSVGFSLLPDMDVLVVDEAHGLEDVAAHHFGLSVSDRRVRQLVADSVRSLSDQPGSQGRVIRLKATLLDRAKRFFSSYQPLFPKTRLYRENIPSEAKQLFFDLDDCLDDLSAILAEHEDRTEALFRLSQRCVSLRNDLSTLTTLSERSLVVWVEKGPRATFLKAAPVNVAPVVQDVLKPRCDTLVLTSATLSTSGNFKHIKSRLGFDDDALEALLASPFDYEQQALLYVAKDHPSPQSPQFAEAVADTVLQLIALSKGHAMVLFTSIRNMHEVYNLIAEDIEYPVFMQGQGSREALLERFREQTDSVLFATGAFWEGVDVQGEALSLLVIDKLPFAPPDEPLTGARVDALKQEGKNAFMEYQVPMAIIALKQGVGRLIRHRLDQGIVAICDPRLDTKPYGKRFLRSLPPAQRVNDLETLEELWRQRVKEDPQQK
jgi:ATP-dependent DNA helicase DinG